MGHTEIYVPNIELPEDYGEPRARLTLPKTVTNSMWEPHPPGWYVMMWFWTRMAGTGLFAIRLPSVLFGIASVLLLFLYGRLESDSPTALLAAGLLAFNGHQVLWSQIARPSTMVSAIGLLSCILLFLATRNQAEIRRTAWLYMATVFAGVAVEHIFWILLAGQMIFSLVNIRNRSDAYVTMLSCQLLTVSAAAPLVTLALFQGGAPHLQSDFLAHVLSFLEFGFLFDVGGQELGRLTSSVRPVLAPLGGALLLTGLFFLDRRSSQSTATTWTGPRVRLFLVLALATSSAILLAAQVLSGYRPAKLMLLSASALLPALACLLAWLLKSQGHLIESASLKLRGARLLPAGSVSLLPVMAIVPFFLTVLVSLAISILASRQLLIMVPYLLLLMAIGMMHASRLPARFWPRAVAAAVLVSLALISASSIGYHRDRPREKKDYQELAHRWRPEIQERDVILVADNYRTTPLFYYMKPRDYHFVGRNHQAEVAKHQPARIWVLMTAGSRDPGLTKALEGYQRSRAVTARNISADLYVSRQVDSQ